MNIKSFDALKESVKKLKPMRVSVAAGADKDVIESLKLGMELGFIEQPILTGDKEQIGNIISEMGYNAGHFDICHADNHADAAIEAVRAITNGDAQILIKGKLETIFYLRAILDKENGIRKSETLSNLTLFEMESYHKLLCVTDNAITPFPTLQEKKVIIENTKILWTSLGIDLPKVAVLAAIELVNPKMQATADAACLSQMAERGQIKGFLIDGPLSYDIAIDTACAKGKHLDNSSIAGDPDLLLMPNLESANILGKSYKFHGNANSGGLVMGASVPVVLNSRSDSSVRRLNSMMMARAIAEIDTQQK